MDKAGKAQPVRGTARLEDLLERPRMEVDLDEAVASLKDAPVLVTGAGGSIGSALAQRLLKLGPGPLVLVDNSEAALHGLLVELDGSTRAQAVLGDATDPKLLEELLRRLRPQSIFHVAAFKQVPLLESQPLAAVANNVFGTWRLAEAARRHGVSRLIMASTDKAVYPESVMGVSKRLAELLLQAWDRPKATSVRLGNVWGSRGSVVPRFIELLERGEPLVVTHPEATRYFISVEEAVDVLIAALELGRGQDILVPELEPPLSILRIARQVAGRGYPIRFSKLRPGDKLREQLFYEAEKRCARRTRNPSIVRVSEPRPEKKVIVGVMKELEALVARADEGPLLDWLKRHGQTVCGGAGPRGVEGAGAV